MVGRVDNLVPEQEFFLPEEQTSPPIVVDAQDNPSDPTPIPVDDSIEFRAGSLWNPPVDERIAQATPAKPIPSVQEIIDDIGPWDPEKIEDILWQAWGLSIWREKYRIDIPTNKEDGMTVIILNFAGSNDDLELNLYPPPFKPLRDFLEREYTRSRIQTLAEQRYTICRKSLGGKDEDFVLGYEIDNEGKITGVEKTFLNEMDKTQIEWRSSNDFSILSCSSVPKIGFYGEVYFVAKPGTPLHTQYIKPFEDELRPYLEREQARRAALATPEPEPTPEEPTPPVRKDDPQVVDPKPVSEPVPNPVIPPHITSQEVTEQTFDGRNIMSGTVEVALHPFPEKGIRIVGQDGKEKAFVEETTLIEGRTYIEGRTLIDKQLFYTIAIDFSGVHSSWTCTLFDKATGQEIGKVTVKNPREVKPEVKPEKPEAKEASKATPTPAPTSEVRPVNSPEPQEPTLTFLGEKTVLGGITDNDLSEIPMPWFHSIARKTRLKEILGKKDYVWLLNYSSDKKDYVPYIQLARLAEADGYQKGWLYRRFSKLPEGDKQEMRDLLDNIQAQTYYATFEYTKDGVTSQVLLYLDPISNFCEFRISSGGESFQLRSFDDDTNSIWTFQTSSEESLPFAKEILEMIRTWWEKEKLTADDNEITRAQFAVLEKGLLAKLQDKPPEEVAP